MQTDFENTPCVDDSFWTALVHDPWLATLRAKLDLAPLRWSLNKDADLS